MPIAHVFKNQIKNCKVITPEGRILTFFAGKHITTIEKDIEFLTAMSKEPGSYVSIDPKEPTIDTEDLTEEGRINRIKREAVAEFLEQQKRAANMISNSKPQELGAGTSATFNPKAPQVVMPAEPSPAKVVASSEPVLEPTGAIKVKVAEVTDQK